MGTVFLTNLATVAGKYERYDVLSAILDFETHNRLPLKSSGYLKLADLAAFNSPPLKLIVILYSNLASIMPQEILLNLVCFLDIRE